MKTKFMSDATTVRVMSFDPSMVHDTVPVRVYSVDFNPNTGFYLTIIGDSVDEPPVIYGDLGPRLERCITTYSDSNNSLGILLTGDKGTGKTMFISLLANRAMLELGLPVVMVRSPYHGEDFERFLKNIGPCCLIFDEFGKMYKASYRHASESDGPSQAKLLSLMDGMDKTKRLILFSENSEYSISEFMLNRPSRIYYHFRYAKISEDAVEDYLNRHEVTGEMRQGIVEFYRSSGEFTFDILQALVGEMKRYNISITEALQDLNIESRARDVYLRVVKFERIDKRDLEPRFTDAIVDSILNEPPDDEDVYHCDTYEFVKPVLDHHSIIRYHVNDQRKASNYIHLESSEVVYENKDEIIYECQGFRVTATPSDYRRSPF